MPDFGAHSVYILVAYGLVALGLGTLYVLTWWQRQTLTKQAELMKAQVKRHRDTATPSGQSDG